MPMADLLVDAAAFFHGHSGYNQIFIGSHPDSCLNADGIKIMLLPILLVDRDIPSVHMSTQQPSPVSVILFSPLPLSYLMGQESDSDS